jgi:hypothetical protein
MLTRPEPTKLNLAEVEADIRKFNVPHRSNTRFVRSAYFCHYPTTPQPKLMDMWTHIELCDRCKQRYKDLASQRYFYK